MSRQSDRDAASAREADARARDADSRDRLSRSVERLEHTLRREPERIGSRSDPKRLAFDDYAVAVPGLASQFRARVPAAFWDSETRDGFERPVAVIRCPCGERPASEAGVPVSCECGRAFVFDGGHVHVAFSQRSAASDAAQA